MNILDRSQGMKRVSSNKGGEYHGPCPLCGGTDRFHIWPQQDDGRGSWWCRGCDKGGDAIQYLRDIEGLSYRSACEAVGKEYSLADDHGEPTATHKATAPFTPAAIRDISNTWQERAGLFVTWSHDSLLNSPDTLLWLADQRGISLQTVKELRLGLNSGEKGKDLYRSRESWGLEPSLKDNGQPKKLWLPIGLTIPHYIRSESGSELVRVRIRRPEGEPRYYVVPGSIGAPMLLDGTPPRPWKTIIIVESELDAIMLHSIAGDLAAFIGLGSCSTRPSANIISQLLEQQRGKGPAVQIRVALDNDPAGVKEIPWWRSNFSALPHPVPGGHKDPGEAFAAGIDLRGWVESALPAAYHINQPAAVVSHAVASKPLEAQKPEQVSSNPADHILKHDRHGRPYYITSSPQEYQRLRGQGLVVFSVKELKLAGEFVGMAKDQEQLAADCIMQTKHLFKGSFLKEVTACGP